MVQRMKKRILCILIPAFTLVFSFSCIESVGTVKRIYSNFEERKLYTQLSELCTGTADTGTADTGTALGSDDYFIDHKLLLMKNSDYTFYLRQRDTGIDYPVVRESFRDQYLHKDFLGNDSGTGTLFVACDNDPVNDRQVIIYGHHMRDGQMFGKLKIFKDSERFNNSGVLYLYSPDGVKKLTPLAVLNACDTDERLLETCFPSDEEFSAFVKEVLSLSCTVCNDIELSDVKRIYTLLTCDYFEEDGSGRLLVYYGEI